ncbi:MAG: DUF4870 domain-containing protein [Gemmatimonadota bacterium]|nr:DUF4870 domain-containing protein [Gemmatimonadota bacterium]
MKKDESDFIAEQAKEAMNFQISMTLYILVSILLIFVVIGIPILIGVVFFDILMTIVAAVKANEGEVSTGIRLPFGCCNHSYLNASIGPTRVAFPAGI